MFEALKSCVAGLLVKPRPLKPQAERQIAHYLQEHSCDMPAFFLRAAKVLEEHELEILFAPQFTPVMEDQAAVSDILARWRPTPADLVRLVDELSSSGGNAQVGLPDGTTAPLPFHTVLVERFVKLLRLDQAPDRSAVEALQDTLPSELYGIAAALMRQRGFTSERQAWYASFVRHMARRQPVTEGELSAAAQFILDQPKLDHKALLVAADELVRAAKSAVAYAQAGRMYWSPDVAQHHQFRGEGRVDKPLVKQRQDELNSLEIVVAALQNYEPK